jgi:ankyrin repeat protein
MKVARGQPNYKRILKEFFQGLIEEDPNMEDFDGNNAFHLAIIRDDFEAFNILVKEP